MHWPAGLLNNLTLKDHVMDCLIFVCLANFTLHFWHQHRIMWFSPFTALLKAWCISLSFFSQACVLFSPSTHQTSPWMRTIWEQRVKWRSLNDSPTPQHKTFLPRTTEHFLPLPTCRKRLCTETKLHPCPPTIARAPRQPSMKIAKYTLRKIADVFLKFTQHLSNN